MAEYVCICIFLVYIPPFLQFSGMQWRVNYISTVKCVLVDAKNLELSTFLW